MMRKNQKKSQGQILVIFAISLLTLLFFVGLALDAGSLYITYGHLKRAVDSAAVAAANEYKRGANTNDMGFTVFEVLTMMNTDMSSIDLSVYICDENNNTEYMNTGNLDGHPDGKRDEHLAALELTFYSLCPNYAANEAAKKLVWVEASQKAPLYFLTLLGFNDVRLTTHTISEAAPLDLVIVLDVSESMGNLTSDRLYDDDGNDIGPNPNPNKFEPNSSDGCNLNNSCQPLLDAKEAAKDLVDTMYDAVDQVSIVTYSNVAIAHRILNQNSVNVYLSDDMENVKNAIDGIGLNDDAPINLIFSSWLVGPSGFDTEQRINFANPEDRDNDGLDDDDDVTLYGVDCPFEPNYAADPLFLQDRWWTEDEGAPSGLFASGGDYEGWTGVPCDRDDQLDVYDWDGNNIWTIEDNDTSEDYLTDNDPNSTDAILNATLAPLSTCIGCGIRTGANVLKDSGRYGSVWVMVFLTDGQANLSDTPLTNPFINSPSAYPNGFCNSELGGTDGGFWTYYRDFVTPANNVSPCRDASWTPRYCIDANEDECPTAPTGVDWTMGDYQGDQPNGDPRYSVLDYARDMVDEAALLFPDNDLNDDGVIDHDEPQGEDIAIYSIGLGDVGPVSTKLLRYMALIGIEGRRDTSDPCVGEPDTDWCGQYYYSAGGENLTPIFEDIASRIFTRISQ